MAPKPQTLEQGKGVASDIGSVVRVMSETELGSETRYISIGPSLYFERRNEMPLSIPIEFCVVKSEPVTPQGHYAYRKIISVKCTWDDLDRLYGEYNSYCFNNIGYMTMLFTRQPDDMPIDEQAKYLAQLNENCDRLKGHIVKLEGQLEQERTWKDQLAEDNRILRERLDIPDSHFKYDGFTVDLSESEPKQEYSDW